MEMYIDEYFSFGSEVNFLTPVLIRSNTITIIICSY